MKSYRFARAGAKAILGILAVTAISAEAQVTRTNPYNPIVNHMYTADPTARVHDGKLFVYPSSDMVCPEGEGSNGFCMPGYNVFSTEDLTNWTDYGNVINHNNVPWVKKTSYGMWAPDAIEHKGKYYLFFPGISADGAHFREIGVAVSDKPEGPFIPREIYIKGADGIDPSPFVDDDGRVYLYWGGGETLNVAEMNQDMTKLITKPKKLEGLPPKYKEGPFMFKRNGIYYFTFPHAPEGSEEIAYGIAKGPMGPVEYKGKILDRWKDGLWTNHHSIVEYNDEWFLFYHHHDISKNNHLRSMAADRITFDDKGNISYIKATKRGIGYVSADDYVQVDRYSSLNNVRVTKNLSKGKPRWALQKMAKNGVSTFDNLDFGEKKYSYLVAYVTSNSDNAKIHVFTKDDKKLADIAVPKTGKGHWTAVKADLNFSPKGMQDLKFTYSGKLSTLQFDWIKFVQPSQSLLVLSGNTPGYVQVDGSTTLTSDYPAMVNSNIFLRYADLYPKAFAEDHTVQYLVNGNEVEAESIAQINPGEVVNLNFVAPVEPPSSDDKIPATGFTITQGVQTEEGGQPDGNIGYIENGDWVTFEAITFDKAVSEVEVSTASATKGGIVEVRLGDAKGKLLASIEVSSSSGWQKYITTSAKLNKKHKKALKGDQSITLVFKGGSGYLMNMSWFRFK